MCRPIILVIIISLFGNTVLASSLSWREEEIKKPHYIRHDIGKDIKGKHDADNYPSRGDFNVLPAYKAEDGMGKRLSVSKKRRTHRGGYVAWHTAINDATDKNFKRLLQLLGKSGRYNTGNVYIPLKFYMKNIGHMVTWDK